MLRRPGEVEVCRPPTSSTSGQQVHGVEGMRDQEALRRHHVALQIDGMRPEVLEAITTSAGA